MPRRRTPPITDAPNGRFLSWLVSFMIYVAALSLASLLLLHDAARTWQQGLEGTITIQIVATGNQESDDQHVQAALKIANAAPGVGRAAEVPEDHILDMLAPWLGSTAIAGDLPLPRLIDVTADPRRSIDIEILDEQLRAAVPDVSVDDHELWLTRLVRLIRAGELLSAIVVALIVAVTTGSVTVATRNGMVVHRDTIEVLHLMGAHDGYIAEKFARRAFIQALVGAIVGLAFAVASILGLAALAIRLGEDTAFDFTLAPWHWATLAILPLVMAAIAMITARLTVLRSLKRMM